MAFILDTNVVSRIRRIERTPPQFREWASGIDYDQAYLSAITLLEVEDGIVGAERHDKAFAEILTTWREQIQHRFAGRILPVDAQVAIRTARLLSIRTVEISDALIAATASEYDFTLVTHNVRHFTGFGLRIFDPFDP